MALTTTEENQLRELLRRTNATQGGRLVSDLSYFNGLEPIQNFVASDGNKLVRVNGLEVANMLTKANVTAGNPSSASNAVNHLMTRDATRSEITRLTAPAISEAKGIGQAAQNSANANTTAITDLRSEHNGRLNALEGWKPTVETNLNRRLGVIGGVYQVNPVLQAGAMNPPGGGAANRIHRFPVPMAKDPMIFFSLQGDVNYPRYEFVIENDKVVGFTLFHSPTGGRWMAVGQQA